MMKEAQVDHDNDHDCHVSSSSSQKFAILSDKRRKQLIHSTMPLYSNDCIEQLRVALEISIENDRSRNKHTGSNYTGSSINTTNHDTIREEEEKGNEGDSGSTSSHPDEDDGDSDDNDERNDGDDSNTGTSSNVKNQAVKTEASTNKTTTTAATTKSKGTKIPQFHPTVIQKQVDALPIVAFDTTNQTGTASSGSSSSSSSCSNTIISSQSSSTAGTCIELPACLLSKDQLLGNSDNDSELRYNVIEESIRTKQCRAYYQLGQLLQIQPIVIILCVRSGRFAAGVFMNGNCIHHTTSVRYTVRKGQGKSQSTQDANSGHKAISIGSQLRRQGEVQLNEDIRSTIRNWKEFFHTATLLFVSIPRTMQKAIYDTTTSTTTITTTGLLQRHDPRIRSIPFDYGRPTYENIWFIYHVLIQSSITLRERPSSLSNTTISSDDITTSKSLIADHSLGTIRERERNIDEEKIEEEILIIPLSELHTAAQNGDAATIESLLLRTNDDITDDGDDNGTKMALISDIINQQAGDYGMTPLHYAAESSSSSSSITSSLTEPIDPNQAATCVRLLLEQGHANPCILDRRFRVPYYLATHDKVRDAFRISRNILGETYCNWDKDAKVGPALSMDVLQEKLEKEAEKRRKKRAKQKEKKAREKVELQLAEERRIALEEQQRKDEEAKRIRDGLQPNKMTTTNGKVCDYCQVVCVGKKRTNMFHRLDYSYCSTDCLQHHKRELMAAAAVARMTTSTSST